VAEMLINSNYPLDLPTKKGDTALSLACGSEDGYKIAFKLVKAGANINIKNKKRLFSIKQNSG